MVEAVRKPFQIVRKDWEPNALLWFHHKGVTEGHIAAIKDSLEPFVYKLGYGHKIIDIAAGANNRVYYPDNYNMKSVTALDSSLDALRLNDSGRKIHADARERIDLPTGNYDLAVSMLGMRYLENQEEVLMEMMRLVKRGSWIVVFDYLEGDDRSVRSFDTTKLSRFLVRRGIIQIKKQTLARDDERQLDMLAFKKPNLFLI